MKWWMTLQVIENFPRKFKSVKLSYFNKTYLVGIISSLSIPVHYHLIQAKLSPNTKSTL